MQRSVWCSRFAVAKLATSNLFQKIFYIIMDPSNPFTSSPVGGGGGNDALAAAGNNPFLQLAAKEAEGGSAVSPLPKAANPVHRRVKGETNIDSKRMSKAVS